MLTVKVTLLAQEPPLVLTVMLPGQVMLGGSVSLTVTLNVQEALLPLASVAVQVTGVVPLRKLLPLAGLQT